MAAFMLSLGPCGALSLCGMCLMEFHFPLVRWVVIFCGSGVKVFFFPFGFSVSVVCGVLLKPCLFGVVVSFRL